LKFEPLMTLAFPFRYLLLGAVLLVVPAASAKCIPIEEAPQKVGDEICVRGTVVEVTQSNRGTWFLNYCADYRTCPFTVVVFAKDLRHVGDVRMLKGKTIEVFGKIRLYNGRPEIVLRHVRQLDGASAKLPPAPRTYDASRRGRYSAGKYRKAKSGKDKEDPPPTDLTPDKQTTPEDVESK
jgi:DNA/RNA endonuclease YhcR with UshA esterase domain